MKNPSEIISDDQMIVANDLEKWLYELWCRRGQLVGS